MGWSQQNANEFPDVSTTRTIQPGDINMTHLAFNILKATRDGTSTIQMYSTTGTIILNMHEYEYSENKCTRVRVRLLYNMYEYDYFRM